MTLFICGRGTPSPTINATTPSGRFMLTKGFRCAIMTLTIKCFYCEEIMDTVKIKKKNTLVVAHRGVSGIETENTSAAFVAAGNRSYYGIETDIHRTADGRFVVCHDGDLMRVAGEKFYIEETSYSVLKNVVLFDKDGSKDREDLRLPLLENYIGICKKYGKHAVLELKTDFTDEEIAKIIDIIRSFEYLDGTTFISFNYENLAKIRALLPNQSVQFLFNRFTDEIIDRLISDGMDADVHYTALNKEIIDKLHGAGVKINCWTVDNKEIAEQLTQWGVDFITTNILE